MQTSDIISSISALIALGSWLFTVRANSGNKRISEAALQQTKKAGAADLAAAWQGVRNIDPKNPITPQVDSALKALQLTAGYWLHDIMERDLIHQLTWNEYEAIYDALKVCDATLPGTPHTGKSVLTHEMGEAYSQMKAHHQMKAHKRSNL